MKTRFVIHNQFSEIVLRLHKQAAPDAIAVLFSILGENTEINGLSTKVVDLKAFLVMLKLAGDDTRRSFDDNKSKVANEVEFWNQNRREVPNGSTNSPVRQGLMTSRGEVHTSKGKLVSDDYTSSIFNSVAESKSSQQMRSLLYTRSRSMGDATTLHDVTNPQHVTFSVAELMGSENRDQRVKPGRGIKGLFTSDMMRTNRSVASVFHSPEFVTTSDPRRTLPLHYMTKPTYTDPCSMKLHMQAGTGVAGALSSYKRADSDVPRAGSAPPRVTSFNEFYLEGMNETSVPQALHFTGRS